MESHNIKAKYCKRCKAWFGYEFKRCSICNEKLVIKGYGDKHEE